MKNSIGKIQSIDGFIPTSGPFRGHGCVYTSASTFSNWDRIIASSSSNIPSTTHGMRGKETNSRQTKTLGWTLDGRSDSNYLGRGPYHLAVYDVCKASSVRGCREQDFKLPRKGKITGTTSNGALSHHDTATLLGIVPSRVPVAVQQISLTIAREQGAFAREQDKGCQATNGLFVLSRGGCSTNSDTESPLMSSTCTAFDQEGLKVDRVDETTVPEKVTVCVMVSGIGPTQPNMPLVSKHWVQENTRFILLVAGNLIKSKNAMPASKSGMYPVGSVDGPQASADPVSVVLVTLDLCGDKSEIMTFNWS